MQNPWMEAKKQLKGPLEASQMGPKSVEEQVVAKEHQFSSLMAELSTPPGGQLSQRVLEDWRTTKEHHNWRTQVKVTICFSARSI